MRIWLLVQSHSTRKRYFLHHLSPKFMLLSTPHLILQSLSTKSCIVKLLFKLLLGCFRFGSRSWPFCFFSYSLSYWDLGHCELIHGHRQNKSLTFSISYTTTNTPFTSSNELSLRLYCSHCYFIHLVHMFTGNFVSSIMLGSGDMPTNRTDMSLTPSIKWFAKIFIPPLGPWRVSVGKDSRKIPIALATVMVVL